MNTPDTGMSILLLYCRPGFEKECAAEIIERCRDAGIMGYVKADPESGFVVFHGYDTSALGAVFQRLQFRDLMFTRQWMLARPLITELPTDDRITPIVGTASDLARHYQDLFLETADTNEAKELSVFLRKFAAPLKAELTKTDLLQKTSGLQLHLFFLDSRRVYVGKSERANSSPWAMGIPRLRFPRGAPSRSTLKLEEAFLHFLGKDTALLQPAMTAVDLGAAPGGWTWQLVRRSIRVIAVDNGPLAPDLIDSGIVHHLRTDGFRYRPGKPVDWMVCDMVEQPSRIADLVGRWLAEGQCRQVIFNLKLPMKKRYEEVKRCREIVQTRLEAEGLRYSLQFKQLYHDREEVTGFCAVKQ